MEAHRHVKFTGVELAAPVKKGMAGRFGGEGGHRAGEKAARRSDDNTYAIALLGADSRLMVIDSWVIRLTFCRDFHIIFVVQPNEP
jgi:hypothetical protein